ncbi:MAG: phosphoribosyltransferase [Actinomycetota bacterium]
MLSVSRSTTGVEFASFADLERAVVRGMARLPADLDLVVGVPRSGMLAATLVACHRHIAVSDLDSFLAGRITGYGKRLHNRQILDTVDDARRILVIDDSVSSGRAITEARERVAGSSLSPEIVSRIEYAAVFATDAGFDLVDHYFEILPAPRMFAWNMMGSGLLEDACVDIDGVLCVDPTDAQNDDGPAYVEFLRNAEPLHVPSQRIGHLVTSRLEKYRGETEAWLADHGVEYGELHMIDLPTAEERRRLGVHASHKAEVFVATDARVFLESDAVQSQHIADRSGRNVICIDTLQLHRPGGVVRSPRAQPISRGRRIARKARRRVRKIVRRLRSR